MLFLYVTMLLLKIVDDRKCEISPYKRVWSQRKAIHAVCRHVTLSSMFFAHRNVNFKAVVFNRQSCRIHSLFTSHSLYLCNISSVQFKGSFWQSFVSCRSSSLKHAEIGKRTWKSVFSNSSRIEVHTLFNSGEKQKGKV